jgi:hypothetical protein
MKKNMEKFEKICQNNNLGKMKLSHLKSTENMPKQPLTQANSVLIV